MSAPIKIDLEKAEPLGEGTAIPAGLKIRVRDRRFAHVSPNGKYWLAGDPVATAWHTALSVAFPKGEAFFIDAVKAHRAGAPPKLDAEIRLFVRQEVNHTREHLAFNRTAIASGYDISMIEAQIDRRISRIRQRSPINNLAATIMLEHLTARIARETLANPAYMSGEIGPMAELWRWHAIEEIEHKGVAYDTWLHATRAWSRPARWLRKTVYGVIAAWNFLYGRIRETCDLLAQDDLRGWKWKARVFWYLFGSPGAIRRILPGLAVFILPGFHPWKDGGADRDLIGAYDSEYPDAVPTIPPAR
ncbi:MAG TPA: metal-dependent hydrolase [Sphingomonadaceae bacterium]|nr:metal-dependent hydrolase [Sphingomonadaceae bacterium]